MSIEPVIDGLGLTSRWVAALRERESLRPDRLFDDPFAAALAGDAGRAMMAAVEADLPAMAGTRGLAVRTRYLDDMLADAVADGVRQVVILAAGMDARAYRLPWPPGTVIFEVERGDVMALKERVMTDLAAQPKAERRAVCIDLREDFAAALRAQGFQPDQPAAFLVEGLLIYLPDRGAVLRILREVAGLGAPGGWIGLDVVAERFLSLPVVEPVQRRLAGMQAGWSFGTDDPAVLMREAGFEQVSVSASSRLPYAPPPPAERPGEPARMAGDAYYLVTARRGARPLNPA